MIRKAIAGGLGSALGVLILSYALSASAQAPDPAAQASPAETATPGIASPSDAPAPETTDAASSQDETTTPIGELPAEVQPFAPPKPGQSPEANVGAAPRALQLGLLHWSPIASQCGFAGPKSDAPDMDEKQPQPLVFVTQVADPSAGAVGLERGYIMANGLVRELEKGKSAPNKDGVLVTVWRSAGEPRINVNIAVSAAKKTSEGLEYIGTMTVHWGDKKEEVPVEGRCASGSGR
ncbi:MAG: hypothetical protein KAG89_15245 [Fulvimarina manganoxydans]|uniref:hypothetical protein n=1 Tax=Fulvimarina manganoxydans TaxID=937218 RepID=UPI00235228F0|nr:hypothetical protein [Fulvimarina manganoxydans]MCK5933515.1 hypothetical protein [Fulvimarina manganoxydans]